MLLAHWDLVGAGELEHDGQNAYITSLTASHNPSQASVHATVGELEMVRDFAVIPPSGITLLSSQDYPLGTPGRHSIGAETWFLGAVEPSTVSFHWAEFRENIPETAWTWPDGTAETFGPTIKEWNVLEGNFLTDTCRDGLRPIGRLWNGQAYVPFTWTAQVPEDYRNEGGQWIHWFTEQGPNEYSGADQSTRLGMVANNTKYGSWQGPYEQAP
jgi:hypothetical protein